MAVLSKLILAAAALAAPAEAVRMHTKASMEMNAMMMTTNKMGATHTVTLKRNHMTYAARL